jgi:hypothetical protein
MPTFMFWNIARTDLSEIIAAACVAHDVDFLVVAECQIAEFRLLTHLNSFGSAQTYIGVHKGETSLRMFTRLPGASITAVFDDGRVSIRRVAAPLGREILLVAAHLPSKLHADHSTQYIRVREVRSEIERAEKIVGHRNTLIIGDLNLNPFEEAMIAADGFHAVMDARIAMKMNRTVQGIEYSFLYNPMWGRLGDNNAGPCGTYYFNNSGASINYYWNTFDQVLIRPELIECFDNRKLKVLTEIGGISLIDRDTIDKTFSDHLPIIVNINTENKL